MSVFCAWLRPAARFSAAIGLALVAAASPGRVGAADPAPAPARIVSLTPSVTEALFALGVGSAVVAVSDYCDFPPEAAALPHVGSFLAPVVERVLAIQPDLVITSPTPGNENYVAAIERAGARVAVVGEGSEGIDASAASILEVARLVGRGARGEELVADMRRRLADVRARVAAQPAVRTALVVDFDPLVMAGPASYLGELIVTAGGTNVADRLGGKWPRSGWEFLIAAAPDVVIDLSQEARVGDGLARWRRFSDIPAVQHGRVHAGDGTLLLHPGPRLPLAAESLARVLHPEAWKKD
jgi:iron complex transport system substrate-binding protein